MSQGEWIDIVTAAELCGCSTQTVRRAIKEKGLLARKVPALGRNGRLTVKVMVSVVALRDLFRLDAPEQHEQRIRAAAPPLSDQQKKLVRQVYLDHFREKAEARAREKEGPRKPFASDEGDG